MLHCNILSIKTRILIIRNLWIILIICSIILIKLFLKLILFCISRGCLFHLYVSSLIRQVIAIFILEISFLLDNFSYLSESYIQRIFLIFSSPLFLVFKIICVVNTSSSLKLIIILCLPPRWINHPFIFILKLKIDEFLI